MESWLTNSQAITGSFAMHPMQSINTLRAARENPSLFIEP
jgi:hypothetical protein